MSRKEKLAIKILLFSFWANLIAAQGEQRQRAQAFSAYDVWGHRFTCRSPYPDQCVWLRWDAAFDPSQHGYHYDHNNNCIVIANNRSIAQLHNISCERHINYTVINATLNQSIELDCPLFTEWYSSCVWKRNDVTVSIRGKSPYTSVLNKFQDCSIRIENVKAVDVGQWTCTDRHDHEIIAAYSLLIRSVNKISGNNSKILEKTQTASTKTVSHANSQSCFTSLLINVFSACTIVLLIG